MMKILGRIALVCALASLGSAGVAKAQIGEPQGSFNITVKQGMNVIASDTVTIGMGGELSDLKATFQDGDPESFTQIGTIGGGSSPIILKVTTDGDASFRVAHWYIDVPVSLLNIDAPGPTSLFQPGGGDIEVTISSFEFDNMALAMPFMLNSPNYYTSFMRDYNGHFYNTPGTHAYNQFGNGLIDVQVPGSLYTDGSLSPYQFDVLASGVSSSWTWKNILAPTNADKVTNQFGNLLNPFDPGYVFELGLSVAFVQVPEPGTLSLLVPAALMVIRRRRKRC
jgi:hypothetical protein